MTRLIRNADEVSAYVRMLERNRISLGLVPTMGALHEGHLSLMKRSYAECDRTMVSVYVNPLQFGPSEDFDQYPRDLDADMEACEREKVDVVFAPAVADMQPPGRSTLVRVTGVAHDYEGAVRDGHFDGVATLVAQLFNLIAPERAYFGQKDYQQTLVVRRMVLDLSIRVRVVVCPTVRDPDGLALSSRNRYLSDADREEALRLPGSLSAVEKAVLEGETDCDELRTLLRKGLESNRKDVRFDYADVVHPETLAPLGSLEGHGVALASLNVGDTRLIDNRIVAPAGTPAWQA